MLKPAAIKRLRALAATGESTAAIARLLGVSWNTVDRYLNGGAEVEVQIRPSTHRLTPDEEALAVRLWAGEARGRVSEAHRLLVGQGIQVSQRTVHRVIQAALAGRPRRLAVSRAEKTPDEVFSFTWSGKSAALQAAHADPRGRLETVRGAGVALGTGRHAVVEGDNLPAMKILRPMLEKKVKLLFFDPPYHSNKQLVYNDRFETENPLAGPRDRAHAGWLSMMLPRLIVARDLLGQDGVLVMTINERKFHHAKMLLDEVFGDKQHLATIPVEVTPGPRLSASPVARNHEYILMYARERQHAGVWGTAIPRSEAFPHHYKHKDQHGVYALFEFHVKDTRDQGKNKGRRRFPLFIDPISKTVSLTKSAHHQIAVFPILAPGVSEAQWVWDRERVGRDHHLLVAKQFASGEWRVFRKKYAVGDDAVARPKSMWTDSRFYHQRGKKQQRELLGEVVFEFSKSVALMREIVTITTRPGEGHIVVDAFAGSGSLGQAVIEMNAEDGGNRQYVGIQSAEPTPIGSKAREAGYETISQITRARLGRVVERLDKQGGSRPGVDVVRVAFK